MYDSLSIGVPAVVLSKLSSKKHLDGNKKTADPEKLLKHFKKMTAFGTKYSRMDQVKYVEDSP